MNDRIEIGLNDFVRDKRLRYRHRTANHSLEDYQESMEDGWGEFPPITLLRLSEPYQWEIQKGDENYPDRTYEMPGAKILKQTNRKVVYEYPAGTLILIGGFTRCQAAAEAGISAAPAVVHEGDWAEALRLAWLENGTHGRPRDSEEVRQVLDHIHDVAEYAQLGEREVARMAGTSRATVNRYRNDRRKRFERAKQQLIDGTPSYNVAVCRDAWGREVPEHLVEEFRCVPSAKKLTQALRETAGKFLKLAYGSTLGEKFVEPGLHRVDVREVSGQLVEAADRFDALLPFILCPTCAGEGVLPDPANRNKSAKCEPCNGEGYLLRAAAENLSGEAERRARGQFEEPKKAA